jgi:hypothetical protein
MNVKAVVAILLLAAVPLYAQAQSPNVPKVGKGEAEKVATIIRGDKIKTQAYCDLQKLAKQIRKAHQKKDRERIDELFRKVETIEETLGPEYRALIDGIQEIAENDQLRAEFVLAFGALAKLCTK